MKYTQILLTVNFILLLALGAFVIWPKGEKQAFVLNQEVFEGFKGKQYLETKMDRLRTSHKATLDSLIALVRANSTEQLVRAYREKENTFALAEQELSEKYTADIWKEINRGIAAYGEEHGYDFILGAAGDGSLMFASDAKNITTEVVDYLNKRYEAN